MNEDIRHEDARWVHRTLAGDKRAFHRLVAKYHRSVYAQILVRIRNPWDAEELTNDVFVKAYQHLDSLRKPCCFGAWLRQIAQYHTLDWLRQQAIAPVSLEAVTGEDAAVVTECLTTETGVEQRLLRKEAYHQVLAAMHCLSAKERTLMEAFYVEDVPYQTLQERYHLSRSSVKKYLHGARQKVRERMEKLYGGVVALPWCKVGRQLFKGGMEAMKLGVKAKVGIGGVAVLLALGGAIVWYASQPIVTQEEMEALLRQETRKTVRTRVGSTKPPQTSVQRQIDVQNEPITDLDSLEENAAMAAWDASLEEELAIPDAPEHSVTAEAQEEPVLWDGMTRAELEVAIPIIEQQIRSNLTYAVDLYMDLLRKTDLETQGGTVPRSVPLPPEVVRERKAQFQEFRQVIRDTGPLGARYKGYLSALGRDLSEGIAWIHELMSPLPVRFEW